MPGRKPHKHKKDKFYRPHGRTNNSVMMTGSSHAADRQLLDAVRDKSLPVGEAAAASVLVEPPGRTRSRRGSLQTDEEAIRPAAALAGSPAPPAGRQDGGGDSDDRTDSAPMVKAAPPAAKPELCPEEEDGCGVKCLYYTLQCCECAIM